MGQHYWKLAVILLSLTGSGAVAQTSDGRSSSCPDSALSRFRTHTVAAGETVAAIANQYNLMPTTLAVINGPLADRLQPGQTLKIPPFNGRVVAPENGQTWQEVAATYDSRADVLFEINGCQAVVPDRIFVPGVFWQSASAGNQDVLTDHPLQSYPLLERSDIIVAYGWQPNSTRRALTFNTGVTLAAPTGSSVLATGDGTVAFVGADQRYGNLIVINHPQGLQTRYANLNQMQVEAGQPIAAGSVLGTLASENGDAFLYFEVRLNSEQGWIAQDPKQYIPDLRIR